MGAILTCRVSHLYGHVWFAWCHENWFPTAVGYKLINRYLAAKLLTRTPSITTTGNREISAPCLSEVLCRPSWFVGHHMRCWCETRQGRGGRKRWRVCGCGCAWFFDRCDRCSLAWRPVRGNTTKSLTPGVPWTKKPLPSRQRA